MTPPLRHGADTVSPGFVTEEFPHAHTRHRQRERHRFRPRRRPVALAAWLVALAILLVLPGVSQAQEAVVIGTVTDDSGGVMPGVVITAIHEASGNRFETITEAGGGFRLPVRVGTYRMTAQLEGFATLTRTGIELLVGQQAVIEMRLAPATLEENVTVSATAPLIDRTSSSVASNVDPRQMRSCR